MNVFISLNNILLQIINLAKETGIVATQLKTSNIIISIKKVPYIHMKQNIFEQLICY